MKQIVKLAMRGFSLMIVFPIAALSGFGRIHAIYLTGAHCVAVLPGIVGDYLRVAFYHLTLEECSLDCRIEFGSFFYQTSARVERQVYVGSYSIFGRVNLGEGTQIASGVQVLSGRRQHPRTDGGELVTGEAGQFKRVIIGKNCWIGAAAIVMADIGDRTTVGAGAVVVKSLPTGVTAVGNPARVLTKG